MAGEPHHRVAGIVDLSLVVARTDDVAVVLTGLRDYEDGFAATVLAMARSGAVAADGLRYGLVFPDDTALVNGDWAAFPDAQRWSAPDRPGARQVRWEHWVDRPAPEGPFAFACEWPAQGIPLTRVELDGHEFSVAIARLKYAMLEQTA